MKLDREEIIKLLDVAIERFPLDFNTCKCVYCGVLPQPDNMSLTLDGSNPRFSVFRWVDAGWMYIHQRGQQYPVCGSCVKVKGMAIPARKAD